jgi:predicted GH43/DUF377 family glycosyl hydrolase
MYIVKRDERNPILHPTKIRRFEALATLNGCPLIYNDNLYLIYRAMAPRDPLVHHDALISSIGMAKWSKESGQFEKRKLFIEPSASFDKYGCEDPRVTFFEGTHYIFYTALSAVPFSAECIKVACAISKDLSRIDSRHLVTPFNAKAMTLFPERINGKIAVLFSAHTDEPPAKMCIAYADTMTELFDETFWNNWHKNIDESSLHITKTPDDHNEVGAPPILTKEGWLLIYSRAQNYFNESERLFTVEAVLLDRDNPLIIKKRTRNPILIPETHYEEYGLVGSIVFPSGALYDERTDTLDIYYGAADMTCARASLNLTHLLSSMGTNDELFERAPGGPIMKPLPESPWEDVAVFNPSAMHLNGKTYILYRAMGRDNTSVIGMAVSEDGVTIQERLSLPIYVPREEFELKHGEANDNSGCEDPRLTLIGDTIYMLYTAYDSVAVPKIAMTSISKEDFLKREFMNWSKPSLISPEFVGDKDSCIFPKKIDDSFMIIHRIDPQICADFVKDLSRDNAHLYRCVEMMQPKAGTWESLRIGLAATPLEVDEGYLMFYHGVSQDKTYSVGVALLDKKDPTIVLSRTVEPIFYPKEDFEKNGLIPNVVFPCGAVLRDKTVYLYYGGADTVTHVATASLDKIMERVYPSFMRA